MPASTAELEHFGARGAQRLRLTGHDRVDQHSGLDSVRAPSFIRADLTTLHRSYSPSLDGIAWQPIRRDAGCRRAPADHAPGVRLAHGLDGHRTPVVATRGAERDRRRLMPLRVRIAGLLIAAGGFGPAAADQPDTANAVIPGGAGVLTKCRGWLVTSSCRTYHHISLPSRIAVGDTITISFGSHPKKYRFSVARIALKDDLCTIVSDADEDRQKIDKINVTPCYRADEGR